MEHPAAIKASLPNSSTLSEQNLNSLKVPPHSEESEYAVLGGIMIDNYAYEKVIDRVLPRDFYLNANKIIYEAIIALVNEQKPCDFLMVTNYLKSINKLEQAGGQSYINSLVGSTSSSVNISSYADVIREHSLLRQLINVGNNIAEYGYSQKGYSASELVDMAESMVFSIAEEKNHKNKTQGPSIISDILVSTLAKIDELSNSSSDVTGLSSGFNSFDSLTSGLQKSDLIIVAGRPSMGKTTFAINVAEHVAVKEKAAVLVFSMEMPKDQLAMRILSSMGRIELQKLRTGKISSTDWAKLSSAIKFLSDKKIYIDDSGALTPTELKARARRISRENNNELGLIVVDYLQLMRCPHMSENRAGEISEISRSLKALAKELNVPVIALSQLNRGVDSRSDRRPMMSDLRESGAIEQDADLIVFIYRDEVYNKESTAKGTAEIIIGKQRNGPIGTVNLNFLGHYSRFDNIITDTVSLNEQTFEGSNF